MKPKTSRLIFVLIGISLLSMWPAAYAYSAPELQTSLIDISTPAMELQPKIVAYKNTIGSFSPGDLFYVDTTKNQADVTLTLLLTNSGELASAYKYLIMKVVVHNLSQESGDVVNPGQPAYLSLVQATATFRLSGLARYSISVEEGSYYFLGSPNGIGTQPVFFLSH